MAEYIEKKRAVDELTRIALQVADSKTRTVAKCISAVELLPTAEVEPVRHAKWEANKSGYLACTNCAWERRWIPLVEHYPRCPNCGARMDKEGEQ